jgi:GNAT superfamily N-acetyltransferase
MKQGSVSNTVVNDRVPGVIRLFDLWHAAPCEARRVPLSRYLAAERIDKVWWKFDGPLIGRPEAEGDRDWEWRKVVALRRSDLRWESLAVQTPDKEIQGAISYRIDTSSFLDPEVPTVYVDRLAAAPRNRPWLVDTPRYRGVGSRLLLAAVCHSYALGLGGRVSLISLPSPRTRAFYQRRGFRTVNPYIDGMMEYELEDQAAQAWLREEGYL